MLDDDRCLLLVGVEDVLYVVDAPEKVAHIGDLVEFRDSFGHRSLGKVTDIVHTGCRDTARSFIGKLREIHRAVCIYHASWIE